MKFPGFRTAVPICLALLLGTADSQTQEPVVVEIKGDQPTARESQALYGLMTEEINYSYDGGIYAELVRNRNFKEDPKEAVHWRLLQKGGEGSMALDASAPLNDAVPASLKLTVTQTGGKGLVGIANEGFWGIPVLPHTRYHAMFYAKAAADFHGAITVSLVDKDGSTTYAQAQSPRLSGDWQKYDVNLTTGDAAPSADNLLVLSSASPGSVWFGFVSLFPPTWHNRANGNRRDIMQLLADMNPAFLRFPGGNYLEGNTIATRFEWKKTIGPIEQRPGHMDDAWKYWSSDGMGLLEFLNWCEDLRMRPLLAVYAGYSLKGERVAPGEALKPFIEDALDEIEYVTGGPGTKWGARRVKDGHPAPFPLEYVEVGNEDQFDRQPGSYEGRFAQFFDALRGKYPKLKIIATMPVTTRTPDMIDEHYYRGSENDMASHAHDYDARPRTGPKIFVGEWATRVGDPTPDMSAALGDAAWMTGMERNSDLVLMSSYAPLFVNVNKGAMQWHTDLIGYDALDSYGSPAYYAQQVFSRYHGDEILAAEAQGVPSREWQPPTPRRRPNATEEPAKPAPRQVPDLFFDATRDSKTGTVFLKVVNREATAQPVHVRMNGWKSVQPNGRTITLHANSPDETNTITERTKIAPVIEAAHGLSGDFTRTFPPYSISVLELKTR